MDTNKLAPGKVAQYYALLAWNGMTPEAAYKMVEENSFEELNNTTYAGDSVAAAKRGIEKYLLNGKVEIDNALITGEKTTDGHEFVQTGLDLLGNFKSEEEICDAIIRILEEIHDKWVMDNPHKYDRGNEAKSEKNLFQHLPTALIGVDEVAKDLMFLAPILEKLGYNVGKMTEGEWGAFIPSTKIVEAYNRYAESYKEANGIKTEEDLADHIAHITETYSALNVENASAKRREAAEQRIPYMAQRVELLCNSVAAKNKDCFTLEPENDLQ